MKEQFTNQLMLRDIITGIIKDCYWDYDVTEKDIQDISESDNFRLKQKLFAKIMYNSTDRLKALRIFNQEDLKKLFTSFSPSPGHKEKFINKHILVLRNILLNEKNKVEGLQWKRR